jgi:hypothetical protein
MELETLATNTKSLMNVAFIHFHFWMEQTSHMTMAVVCGEENAPRHMHVEFGCHVEELRLLLHASGLV